MKTKQVLRYGSSVTVLDIPTITLPSSPPPADPTLLFDGRWNAGGGYTAETVYESHNAINAAPKGNWQLYVNSDVVTQVDTHMNRLIYRTAARRRSSGFAAEIQVGGVNSIGNVRGERIEPTHDFVVNNPPSGRMRHKDWWTAGSFRCVAFRSASFNMWPFQRGVHYGAHTFAEGLLLYNSAGNVPGVPDKLVFYLGHGGQPAGPVVLTSYWITDGTVINGQAGSVVPGPTATQLEGRWVDWMFRGKFERTTAEGPITELWMRVANSTAAINPSFTGGGLGTWTRYVNDTVTPNYMWYVDSPNGDLDQELRISTGLYKPGSREAGYLVLQQGGTVVATSRAAAEAAAFS